jgi:hypothetical protein
MGYVHSFPSSGLVFTSSAKSPHGVAALGACLRGKVCQTDGLGSRLKSAEVAMIGFAFNQGGSTDGAPSSKSWAWRRNPVGVLDGGAGITGWPARINEAFAIPLGWAQMAALQVVRFVDGDSWDYVELRIGGDENIDASPHSCRQEKSVIGEQAVLALELDCLGKIARIVNSPASRSSKSRAY